MSLTGTLLFATGLAHNVMGILSPRLREPLLRIVADGGTVVTADANERYAREDTFWFQFAGIALMIHGWHVRSIARQFQKQQEKMENNIDDDDDDDDDDEATTPAWLGWVVLAAGTVGAYCKPVSGFHMVYLQGLHILWIQRKNRDNGLDE